MWACLLLSSLAFADSGVDRFVAHLHRQVEGPRATSQMRRVVSETRTEQAFAAWGFEDIHPHTLHQRQHRARLLSSATLRGGESWLDDELERRDSAVVLDTARSLTRPSLAVGPGGARVGGTTREDRGGAMADAILHAPQRSGRGTRSRGPSLRAGVSPTLRDQRVTDEDAPWWDGSVYTAGRGLGIDYWRVSRRVNTKRWRVGARQQLIKPAHLTGSVDARKKIPRPVGWSAGVLTPLGAGWNTHFELTRSLPFGDKTEIEDVVMLRLNNRRF